MKIDFKAITEKEMAKTGAVIKEYPWQDKFAYAVWLAQTFHMVNHSTRLVALAGAYAPTDRNFLHHRFVDHSKEERGHELICISDLKAIDYKLEQLPSLYAANAMYQIQYYWIQHRGAASFFGYTLSLEALAENWGPWIYEKVAGLYGKQAAKFLKLHGEADIGHLKEAYENIEQLNPQEAKMALENLEISAELYRQMLINSRQWVSENSHRKAG